jgi:electron transport complex protein RnfG
MAAKKESTILGMIIALLIVTLASSASLGYMYQLTKAPIDQALLKKKNLAIKKVTPEFDNSPVQAKSTSFTDGDSLFFYRATQQDSLVGVAVETFTNQGFGGLIKLMVGFLPDGTIKSVAVLEHKETPGLGDKMAVPPFSTQFEGVHPEKFSLKVKKDGGNVDAITASTITSRAYCDAVQRAYNEFIKGE